MLVAALAALMVLPWSAVAATPTPTPAPAAGGSTSSGYIPGTLLSQAQANPNETFDVIIQGDGSKAASGVANQVANWAAQANQHLVDAANQADNALQQAQQQASAAAQTVTQAQNDYNQAQSQYAAKLATANQATQAANAAQATAARLALLAVAADLGLNKAAAHQADDAAHHASDYARNLAQQAQHAQQDASNAQTQVLQKLQVLQQAQQAAAAAQAAVTQAQTADTAAHAAIGSASAQILKQQVTDEFLSISGVAATLTGAQLAHLVQQGQHGGLLSITPNAPVQIPGISTPATGGTSTAGTPATGTGTGFNSTQIWPYESKSANNWKLDRDPSFDANQPSIAVVDSGIQPGADFGNRIVGEVNLSTLPNNSDANDDSGHGTFVAGVAADGLPGVTGADPAANLVDVKVMDSTGMGKTSDIINACQWILKNAAKYNIKVVNLSLQSNITAPFFIDPLDRAVEQLWFSGITVVVAAGNYGVSSTQPSGELFSPADDPFVITVGAADPMGSTDPTQATMAPWSAWGYTVDGFEKPELSAPGRYMIAPVPTSAALTSERPASVISSGYMELSGTSFATPIVSAAAANILTAHPSWTPDQVKGALMLTAKGLSGTDAGGVGVVQASDALNVSNPPNPNAGLDQFVTTTNGTPSFNEAAWASTAQSNASWDSVSWNDASWDSASWDSASWNSASWDSVSWNDASWDSASWNDASWDSASWNDASWNSASWNDVSWNDGAQSDTNNPTDDTLATVNLAQLLAQPDFDPSTLPPGLQPASTKTTPTGS